MCTTIMETSTAIGYYNMIKTDFHGFDVLVSCRNTWDLLLVYGFWMQITKVLWLNSWRASVHCSIKLPQIHNALMKTNVMTNSITVTVAFNRLYKNSLLTCISDLCIFA